MLIGAATKIVDDGADDRVRAGALPLKRVHPFSPLFGDPTHWPGDKSGREIALKSYCRSLALSSATPWGRSGDRIDDVHGRDFADVAEVKDLVDLFL